MSAGSRSKHRTLTRIQLTRDIKQTPLLEDLLKLHALYQNDYDEIHTSATWQKIYRLPKPRGWKSLAGVSDLQRTTVRLLTSAGAREVANVAYGAARARYSSSSLFNAVVRRAEESVGEFRPQDIANTAWAFATVKHRAPKLFIVVAKRAEESVEEFKPQELANTCWAFATVNHLVPKLFDVLTKRAVESVGEFKPQELANTCWAFVTVNHRAPKLFNVVAKKAEETIVEFKPMDFANIAWAFATVNHRAPKLFNVVAKMAEESIGEFKPQNLANIVWAFATVNHLAPKLFNAGVKRAEESLGEFKPQDLANTVWAFATVYHLAPKLFNAVAGRAEERVKEFSPQNLANTVWAFATVNHRAPKFFNAVAKRAEESVGEFNPQGLANIAWALATVNHRAPKLFNIVAKRVEESVEKFKPQNLANTVWAFATVTHPAPKLFNAVAKIAEESVEEFKPQGLANTVWAFATVNRPSAKLFKASSELHRRLRGSPDVRTSALEDKASLNVGDVEDSIEDGEISVEVAEFFCTLRGQALRRLDEFGPLHLISLYWAYSTAGLLDDELHKQLIDVGMRLGKARDAEGFPRDGRKRRVCRHDRCARETHCDDPDLSRRSEAEFEVEMFSKVRKHEDPSCNAVQSSSISRHECNDQPFVMAEGKHWMVLYKPPFWEVTVDSKEAMKQVATTTPSEDEDDGGADDVMSPGRSHKRPRLHMWIRQHFAQVYPVCTDRVEAFGILHRLDAQTSGLLVCAKTYVGAYWLRLQWCAYTVDKEYVCLVHGKVDPNFREIHKRIRIDKRRVENSRKTISTHSKIHPSGKPSYTELVTLAHLVRHATDSDTAGAGEHSGDPSIDDECFSLIALKLHTGRTHQIRVHMLSIGHPLVCDSKYAEDQFLADRKWCTRNFLHTYRVGFEDAPSDVPEDESIVKVSVFCPLPQDLRDALGMLTPVDDSSRGRWEEWLAGDSAQLREFDAYARADFVSDVASA